MSKNKEKRKFHVKAIERYDSEQPHHRRRRFKTKKQSNTVIHVKTQLLQYGNQQLKKSSLTSSSVEYSKNVKNSTSVNKISHIDSFQSQISQNTHNTHHKKRESKKNSNCSIKINKINPIVEKSHSQSSKNIQNNDNIINIKNEGQYSNTKGVANDFHRNFKKRNKKYTRRRVLAFIIGCLLLSSVLIITFVIIFLKKSTESTNTKSVLLRWNPVGVTIAGVTGMLGNGSNKLNGPWDVVVDWSYTLYISDRANHRIQKFLKGSTNGFTVAGNTTAGVSSNTLNYPCTIHVDANDNIYVADRNNHRIQFWANSATFGVTIVGNGTPGDTNTLINFPYSVQIYSNTNMLYITEHDNHRISSYRVNDSTVNVVAGGNGPGLNTTQLWFPHSSFFDELSNSFLIANAKANNIVRWKLGANNWTLVAGDINGSSGNTSGLLNFPSDVTMDPMGNIYVVDRNSHRVQQFLDGRTSGTTIAGVGTLSGSNSTLLNGPVSLAFDGQLNLYVTDLNNHRVQKFYRY